MPMSGTMLTRALAALKVSSVLQHAGFGAGACSDRPLVINHGEPGRRLSLLSFNKYKCSQEENYSLNVQIRKAICCK